MGAFDDIESHRPSSPSFPKMLGRGMGDARRKIILLALVACFLIFSFAAFKKHEQIGDMIDTKAHAWSDSYTPESSYPSEDPAVDSEPSKPLGTGIAKAKTPLKEKVEKVEEEVEEKKEAAKEKSATAETSTHLEEAKKEASKQPTDAGPHIGERSLSDTSLEGLRNETLGFEQIYVLNMAGRTDKLDAMRLASSVTGFNFKIMPGVSGADVPAKALSGVFEEGQGKNGVIGCWRGHMNFAHEVVNKRLSSALVMEDDADWDVDFRAQLERVALGSQALLDTPKSPQPLSPYGDGWDLIWLGHCASQPKDGDSRRVLMKNDATTTPPQHRVNFGGVPDMEMYENTTRVMYFSKGSTCTYAYAISFHGAQKILKWLSMDVYNKPVDFGLHDMCADAKRGFKCIGIFPQIVGDHKPPGGATKDSDIGTSEDGDEASKTRTKGFSYNIVKSTRLNIDLLIDGHREAATSQWPDDTPEVHAPVEMELRQDELPDTPD